MKWYDIRTSYPNQWLLVEALKAHSESNKRVLEELSILSTHHDSSTALKDYRSQHQQSPQRELYVLHTSRENLEIEERQWLGIRTA